MLRRRRQVCSVVGRIAACGGKDAVCPLVEVNRTPDRSEAKEDLDEERLQLLRESHLGAWLWCRQYKASNNRQQHLFHSVVLIIVLQMPAAQFTDVPIRSLVVCLGSLPIGEQLNEWSCWKWMDEGSFESATTTIHLCLLGARASPLN